MNAPNFTAACRRCRRAADRGALGRCPACGGILQPAYAAEAVAGLGDIAFGRGIDRYRATLPVDGAVPNLGEGGTPLLPLRRLGASLGLEHLYGKHEGLNPSGAFKDRAGALVVALAREVGASGVLCVSSGNASAAVSTYCAATGLDCVILLEPGNPPAKLRQTLATGARVVGVEEVFRRGPEALAALLPEVAARLNYYLGFVWAPVNPYVLEGLKTIAYEIVAQLGGAPEVVVVPVGGGDLLAAQGRGYAELVRAGVIDAVPRLVGVQSPAAPPLLRAFEGGLAAVPTLPTAVSRISGINVAFSGDHALDAVRASRGRVVGVTDEAILAMQRRLAEEEGIWVEPAGAAAVAGAALLRAQRVIAPATRVVAVMTGAGFKDGTLAAERATAVGAAPGVAFDATAIATAVANRYT